MKGFMSISLCAVTLIIFSGFTTMDAPAKGADPEKGTYEQVFSGSTSFSCDGFLYPVDYEVIYTTRWHRVLANDGSYHYHIKTVGKGVFVGEDGKWILNGHNEYSIKEDPAGGEATVVRRSTRDKLVGTAGLPDYNFEYSYRSTIDANGNLRVSVSDYNLSCE